AGGSDAWIIKTDTNGSRLWDKTFGGTNNESAASVQQTSDGGYIISGTTSTYGAGGSNAWLLYVLNDESTIANSLPPESPESVRGFKIIMSVIGLLAAVYIVKKFIK
ncbi:MAG: PGF-CTERM sorting domain-containing protein, partial [Candidatus Methanoperedens sp.]